MSLSKLAVSWIKRANLRGVACECVICCFKFIPATTEYCSIQSAYGWNYTDLLDCFERVHNYLID